MHRTRNLRILNIHTPAQRRPQFPCSHCVRGFFNKARLKSHIQARHPDIQDANPSKSSSPQSQPPSDEQGPTPQTSSIGIQDIPSSSPKLPSDVLQSADDDFDMDDNFDRPISENDQNHYYNYGNEYDYDYRYDNDNNRDRHANNYQYQSGSSSRSSTPVPITFDKPGPPGRHVDRPLATEQNFTKRVHHRKLNGTLSCQFLIYQYLI